ncbi:MAG: NAD(P)-dependent oxidoreductase [Bacteroidota bacterium]
MKIGIIREGKTPPDSRVPLTPPQCAGLLNEQQIDLVVQQSPNRCYTDEEYAAAGVPLTTDVEGCEVLLGVKEVPIEQLLPNKTYFFFSHTIKKQAYNRNLLQAVLQKNIRLIDWETLTNRNNQRLIAFGRFAGMVGAHNALVTYGLRTGAFSLKRMKDCYDYAEAKALYKQMEWPAVKIVLTGTGRVGNGAADVLRDMGIRQVSVPEFLTEHYEEAVFTQLLCSDYATRLDHKPFSKPYFYKHPELHRSIFGPFTKVADIMINGIYWDNNAPAFFTVEDMAHADFNIEVIADVTCDIAPVSSIPSTLRASTIADPIFGFNPNTGQEAVPHQVDVIDMMTIDNLPNELPRDASAAFGEQFLRNILPELLNSDSEVITKATITKDGALTRHFEYLRNYVEGIE